MTIKKNLENEKDRRWRDKGGPHKCPVPEPIVCPVCKGEGVTFPVIDTECDYCGGTGEVWE